jgi:hypothetical protein
MVWDGRGQPLWAQRKQGPFRLEPWQLAHPETEPFFPGIKSMKDKKQLPDKQVIEGIRRGGELAVVETALGRVALLICADALEPEQGYVELAGRVQADLVFIVAMTPKTAQFDKARSHFVEQNIGVVFVNTACTCRPGRRHTGEMVLVDLSLQESGDLPPTRWSWRIEAEPEWCRYRSPEERKAEPQVGSTTAVTATEAPPQGNGDRGEDWRPLRDLPVREGEEPVATLLEGGIGFVLNLGQYFRRFLG